MIQFLLLTWYKTLPKKYRIHYRHAFYHVMLRGNYRQDIFYDRKDREHFYQILENSIKVLNYKVHLFCLMTNHVHLVIEVHDIPLSKIMQCINTQYSKKHNKRFNQSGHLFQGRYKSKLIQNDNYLLELCYYIHINPIKARICKSLCDYPWSSHLTYCEKQNIDWLTTDHIKQLLIQQVNAECNHYTKFILEKEKFFTEPVFCDMNNAEELIVKDSVSRKMQNKPSLALENIGLHKIAKIVCEHLNVPINELASNSQKSTVSLARSMITYYAHYHAKYTLQDIASTFGRQANSISKTLQRHLRKSKDNHAIQKTMDLLERKLSISNIDTLLR